MAINQQQITKDNGVANVAATITPVPAQSMTDAIALIRQMPFGFKIRNASVYCRTYTATLSARVGLVRVGKTVAAVTLVIGTTTTKFKLNSAVIGLSGTIDANTGLATIVNKAVTDNLAFSAAYTINVAGAAGVKWGAFRVQMAADGTISTRAYAQDQAFTLEADAILNCPAAAANMIDLGTISVSMLTATTFTAGTTALTGGNISAVNYNGAVAGFVDALTTPVVFVAANLVNGTKVANGHTRTAQHPGSLIVVLYTSDGSMVVTDPEITVNYRPWPLNNEAPFLEN